MSYIPGVQAFKEWYHKPREASKEARELREAYEKTKKILTEETEPLPLIQIDTALISSTSNLESSNIVVDVSKQSRKKKIESQVQDLATKELNHTTAKVAAQVSPFAGRSGKILVRCFEVATALSTAGTVAIGVFSSVTSKGDNFTAALGGTVTGALLSITGGIWYVCQLADARAEEQNALSKEQIKVLRTIADGELLFINNQVLVENYVNKEDAEKEIDNRLEESLAKFREIDLSSNPEIARIQEEIETLGMDAESNDRRKNLLDRLGQIKNEIEELETVKNKTVCRVIQNLPQDNPLLLSLQGVFKNSAPVPEPKTSVKKPTKYSKSTPVPLTPKPTHRTTVQMKFSSAMSVSEAEKLGKSHEEDPKSHNLVETVVLSESTLQPDMDETGRAGGIEMEDMEANNRIVHFNRLCQRLGFIPKQLFFEGESAERV